MSLERAQGWRNSLPAGKRGRAVIFRWFSPLDNFNPVRNYGNGFIVQHPLATVNESGYALFGIADFPSPTENVYVIDNGKTASPFYVSGYPEGVIDEFGPRIFLHPYQVNPDNSVRSDSGLPNNFSSWTIGPRRSYHLKLFPLF